VTAVATATPEEQRENGGEISPWKLGGLGVGELARRVWAEFTTDEVTDRAAALAYYFLFSLFPALLFLTALLGFLPVEGLMDRLMGYLDQVLPGDSGAVVKRTLAEVVTSQRGGLLSFGALLALWSASNGMASVMSALNIAYDLEDQRSWWRRRLVAVALTLGFAVMILAGLVFLVFGGKIGAVIAGWLGLGDLFQIAWNTVSLVLAVVLVLIGIALVYYLAPAARQHWRWVTPGSVLALALWLVMSFALRLYVTQFGDYNATYGSIGGVILLMLWLYLTGVVLLLGAEVNAEIEHAAARRGAATAKAPGEHAPGAASDEEDVAGEAAAAALTQRRLPERDKDVVLAARVVTRRAESLRREGWLTVWAVAAGALLGWAMSGRPLRDVARRGAQAAATGRTVAAAIAARERLQAQRSAARRARDGRRAA